MNNDSTCGLKIKQIIAMLASLVIIATISQAFIFNQREIKVATEEIEVENIIEQAEVRNNFERKIEGTTRSSSERIIEENNQEEQAVQYISIEEITISKDMDLTQRCGISKEDFINLTENMQVDHSGFF